ncbi:MAG: hypothetical protein ACQEXV_22185 [Bacillota bacterium]
MIIDTVWWKVLGTFLFLFSMGGLSYCLWDVCREQKKEQRAIRPQLEQVRKPVQMKGCLYIYPSKDSKSAV